MNAMAPYRRRRRFLLAAGLPASVLLVMACAHDVRTGTRCDLGPVAGAQGASVESPALVPEIPGSVQPMPLDAVNLTDPAITHKVIAQATGGRRTRAGVLAAWARLVNCTDHDLVLQGRTHFFDGDHREVEPATAWDSIVLPARGIQTYETFSTDRQAMLYRIELRERR